MNLFDFLNKILVRIFNTLCGTNMYFLGLFVFCIVCAYLCAWITDSEVFKNILIKLGITRTFNKNIWADVINSGDYLEVYLSDPERIYYGQVDYIEEDSENPWLVLSNYTVKSPDGENTDHVANQQHYAMLNTSKVTRIKIVRADPQEKKKLPKFLFRRLDRKS